MQPEDAEDAAFQQANQVRERAIRSIAQHHISVPEMGPQFAKQGQLMRVQGADYDISDCPGRPAEQHDQTSDGKAAARLLGARLGEGFLEFGLVGHADRGAVHDPDPSTQPRTYGMGQGPDGLQDSLKQSQGDFKRQSLSCLAVGARIRGFRQGLVQTCELRHQIGDGWIGVNS